HLSRSARTFLSCLPNAGLPSIVDGATHYDLTPDELAAAHDRFTAELGVNIVGGCCGTTPEHLRRVIETVGGRVPAERRPVVEPGLQHIGGRAILNSANLEDGEAPGSRCDRVFALAREYGAAVICLTIDEEGQARTADWKFRVAKRLCDLAVERYGLEPGDLIFDALTFP